MSSPILSKPQSFLKWNCTIGVLAFVSCSLHLRIVSLGTVWAEGKPESSIAALQKADKSFEAFEAQLLTEARRKVDRFGEAAENAYVFELIGKYRLVRGAPVLLDQLESQPLNPTSEFTRLTRFPAAAALVEIGSPCVGKIFDYCRQPLTNLQADIIACVLASIYGDNEIASMIVKKELARVKSIPPRKVNVDLKALEDSLHRVLSYLRDKDYSKPSDWPR